MEIKDMTAVQLSAAIKEGKITVADAVEASLAAVKASDERSCDDVCVKDPAELCSDVRCRGYHTARRGGSRYHRKDKHG